MYDDDCVGGEPSYDTVDLLTYVIMHLSSYEYEAFVPR